jgi:hypothetical protein
MSPSGAPDREQIIAMLAAFGDRAPEAVPERIGSLELTWPITGIEQQYSVVLDLSDDDLAQMTTVSSAVAAFRDALAGAGRG